MICLQGTAAGKKLRIKTSTIRNQSRKRLFFGLSVDLADGFIHFSAPDQVQETAAIHFAFQDDLLLLAVDDAALGHSLVWEVSRGGALFPHLYRHLAIAEVVWAKPLPMRADGTHDFAGLL